jgi:hypothetical protein
MSTSLLYHCFGITGPGIHHVNSRFKKGRTIFRIAQDPTTLACSACGSLEVRKKEAVSHRDELSWCWDRRIIKLGFNPFPIFNDLRHTWKTNARRSGMDEEAPEAIMGHWYKAKSVSERYGVISDEELVKAIDLTTFHHGGTVIIVQNKKKKSQGGSLGM